MPKKPKGPIMFPPPKLLRPRKKRTDPREKGHTAPLDSWDPKTYLEGLPGSEAPTRQDKRPEEKELSRDLPHHGGRGRPLKRAALEKGPEILDPVEKKKRERARIRNRKTRKHALQISVSQEEKDIVYAHVSKMGVSFSEWARAIMFREMGKSLPERPGDLFL